MKEERHSQAGCSAGRMQLELHHGLLGMRRESHVAKQSDLPSHMHTRLAGRHALVAYAPSARI